MTAALFANRSYAILKLEPVAAASNPGNVALSQSLGVPATRATTAEEFTQALRRGIESKGPNVVEVPM